uniref:non-specific serine/threonine protein kinase n=1 Tax=Chenopodium quinoa TaxID=63459 RepID=A0A803L0L2_CHEQI
MGISSVYWPDIGLVSWEAGRITFNDSRVANFDSNGHFQSFDDLQFNAIDYGMGPQRRLTLDFDGNLRMYSLEDNGQWLVTWEAFIKQCNVNGLCGPNNLCKYSPYFGRKCTCLPGFKLKDHSNWMHGCEPEFEIPNNISPVPKNISASIISPNSTTEDQPKLYCDAGDTTIQLQRDYRTKDEGGLLKFMLWFAVGTGQNDSSKVTQDYDVIFGFKRFSHDELRKATKNFREEIGRGSYGVVYKGKLEDGRVAAIKKLVDGSDQGVAELLAEVSTIGRLNHMNLIDIWGYSAQGRQRLLVLEYMENKSLAEKLSKTSLSWERRYEIALGLQEA